MKEFLVVLGSILTLSLIIIIASVALITGVIFLIMQQWGIGFLILLAFIFLNAANHGIFKRLNNFLGIK